MAASTRHIEPLLPSSSGPVAVGQALETDTALSCTILVTVHVGQAVETDSAFNASASLGTSIPAQVVVIDAPVYKVTPSDNSVYTVTRSDNSVYAVALRDFA